jgi:hypothetical protein
VLFYFIDGRREAAMRPPVPKFQREVNADVRVRWVARLGFAYDAIATGSSMATLRLKARVNWNSMRFL